MIQVYDYYISHHLSIVFANWFSCLPSSFALLGIRTADKGRLSSSRTTSSLNALLFPRFQVVTSSGLDYKRLNEAQILNSTTRTVAEPWAYLFQAF